VFSLKFSDTGFFHIRHLTRDGGCPACRHGTGQAQGLLSRFIACLLIFFNGVV
jgi:hypothetical protein